MLKTRKLIARMQEVGLPDSQIHEAVRCLDLGVIRMDWMAAADMLQLHIQNAESIRERNYWTCMKKMAELP